MGRPSLPGHPRHALWPAVLLALAAASAAPSRALLHGAATPTVQRVDLRPCRVPGFDEPVRCGTRAVFENRGRHAGRTIALNIVVVPASSSTPAADPVFWLHGGPGAAATDVVGAAKGGFLEPLRRDRDLVFVDQRGTGASNRLACDMGDDPRDLDAFFGALFPRDKVLRCRDELAARADLTQYTTPIAMDDLDEVREALGYRTIDLVAASYGTIAAQAYLRQHGDHVRSVFLVGVATPGVKQPLLFARAAQHALDRLFADCSADATCRAAFPNLAAEFDGVLARFKGGSLRVEMVDPAGGSRRAVALTYDNYVERIRLLLYTTTFARFVPLIVHQAYNGDFVPFETLAIRYNPGAILARGMYMTVTCSEGVPFITDTEMADQARGTFVGEDRVRAHRAACADWPHRPVSRSFIDPVKSDRPVVMFSGDVDGSTPPWFAEQAVKYLPNGRQTSARYYGHQLDSPCLWRTLSTFVTAGRAEGLDTRCAAEIRRPPFATEIPAAMALPQRAAATPFQE
jgi:pimeloyl-ACP methyl ester carboxylesterase